jgi:hypothetical protein
MPKQPRRRRETPAPAANDNKPHAKPVVRFAWDVYRAAARLRYVGQVIAADADEAIEAAAVELPVEGGIKIGHQAADRDAPVGGRMTRSRGGTTRSLLDRNWPHQVALPAENLRGAENSTPIYALAKELAGEPRRYRLERDGRELVVFCFAERAHAQAFAERFGGELVPVPEMRGTPGN